MILEFNELRCGDLVIRDRFSNSGFWFKCPYIILYVNIIQKVIIRMYFDRILPIQCIVDSSMLFDVLSRKS